jgi:hypothetical protein
MTPEPAVGPTFDGFRQRPTILPRSSPAVVSWLARRAGRQTSGAARWATGRRAIAGGDGATRVTGGDGATRIIGRWIGIAGATMRGRGRCRQRGAENDCGGERDCCPARHCRISGLSCRGLTPSRLATAAPPGNGDGVRRSTARQYGSCKAKPIKFARGGIRHRDPAHDHRRQRGGPESETPTAVSRIVPGAARVERIGPI